MHAHTNAHIRTRAHGAGVVAIDRPSPKIFDKQYRENKTKLRTPSGDGGRFREIYVSTEQDYRQCPKGYGVVLVGKTSSRAFRRYMVRYWHPLLVWGNRAILQNSVHGGAPSCVIFRSIRTYGIIILRSIIYLDRAVLRHLRSRDNVQVPLAEVLRPRRNSTRGLLVSFGGTLCSIFASKAKYSTFHKRLVIVAH